MEELERQADTCDEKALREAESPLVTVIIPTHNRQNLLPRAIDSVLDQTYPHFELIVIDDCSTDNTPQVVASYVAKDPRVRSGRNSRNLDAQESRNIAVEMAKGGVIAFLDDDDMWLPDKLELQLPLLKRFSIVGCMHAYDRVPSNRSRSGQSKTAYKTKTIEQMFFSTVGFSPSKFVTRKSYLQAVGGFDSALPGPEGLDLVVRIMSKFGVGAYLTRMLAVHFTNHGLERITSSRRLLRGCVAEFQKNRDLRSPSAARHRSAHIEFIKMRSTRNPWEKVKHLAAGLSWFELSHARDHLRLYRSMLILPFPPFSWMHVLYRSYRNR